MVEPARRVPVSHEPIVPGARFTVTCACGAAFDSDADTSDQALADIRVRHRCHDKSKDSMIAEAVDYKAAGHPLAQRRYAKRGGRP